MPESSGDDGDTFGSLLLDASRAGASESDRLPGAMDDPGADAETAIDQPGDDRRALDDVHKHAPSRAAQPGLVAPDQALVAALALISPYPAAAPEINGARAAVPARAGSGSDQSDVIAATGERSTMAEPVDMQPGRIPVSTPDASSLSGQPVALTTQTRLQGELASELRGELATGLQGELATELKGELATELQGEPATELKGELATELKGEPATGLRGGLASELRGEPATGLRGELASELRGEPATGLQGEPATELRGELAAGLQGELATELQGELATELRGELASELRGELATVSSERSDAAGATTPDDAAIKHEPDPIEAGEVSPLLTASTRVVPQRSGPLGGARLGFGDSAATENGRQANIDEMVKQAAVRRLGTAGRLGLDISTDRLGSIRLDASETSSGLQLNLGADRASTRAMLSHELAALRADLGAGHDVRVDLGARSDTPQGRRQSDQPSQTADMRPSGSVRPIRERDASLAPRRASILALDALDLRL
jgi:hypothetical protein